MSNKKIHEDDIRPLLLKAIELQDKHPKLSDNREKDGSTIEKGISVEELEALGREAGIDPKFLEHALLLQRAGGLVPGKSSKAVALMGRAGKIEDSFVIDRILTEDQLQSLSSLLGVQHSNGGQGSVNSQGLVWKSNPPTFMDNLSQQDMLKVTITPGDKRCLVKFSQGMGQTAGGIFGGIIGGFGGGVGFGVGFGVGIGALGSLIFAGIFTPLVIATSYGIARWSYTKLYDEQQKKLENLKREILQFTESLPPQN